MEKELQERLDRRYAAFADYEGGELIPRTPLLPEIRAHFSSELEGDKIRRVRNNLWAQHSPRFGNND